MSDELKQFEGLLKVQPLREVPAEWRNEILSAAEKAQTVRSKPLQVRRSLFAFFGYQLRSLLWPHPVAWGGLAAVWIFILAAHVSMRDEAPAIAKKTLPLSPEVVAELKQQKQLLAELMGTGDSSAADRQKTFAPKPRSERVEFLTL
jgi:hypothetical protein